MRRSWTARTAACRFRPHWLEAGAGVAFCCSGCHTAYDVLHDHGLAGYYRLGELRPLAVRVSGDSFEEFDHPSFAELYVRTRADGLSETRLLLEGIHCASCVWLVERVPLAVPGVAQAELDVTHSRVQLAWDPASHATVAGGALPGPDRLSPAPRPRRPGATPCSVPKPAPCSRASASRVRSRATS